MTPIVLRCTAKLAKLLRLGPSQLREPLGEGASEWCGNLLWLDGRKCLLFTHADTLFCFLVADVLKADILPIGPFLASHIEFELATEELAVDTFGLLDPTAVSLAKTTSRSVLGSMNDLAFRCEAAVDMSGGLATTDIAALNRRLRRNPLSAIGYNFAIDLARRKAAAG